MNALLQSQLDRVETALNTLIDSITSYNPSVNAANDLVIADDELSRGLEERERCTQSLVLTSISFVLLCSCHSSSQSRPSSFFALNGGCLGRTGQIDPQPPGRDTQRITLDSCNYISTKRPRCTLPRALGIREADQQIHSPSHDSTTPSARSGTGTDHQRGGADQ